MRMIFLTGILLPFLYSGCVKPDSPNSDSPAEVLTARDKGLTAEVIPLPNPNEYMVRISVHNIEEPIVIRKSGMKGSYLLDSKPMADVFQDKDVAPGETYAYEALLLETGEAVSEVTLTIPKDLVIKGSVRLQELTPEIELTAHRIFFTENSVLITDGRSVQIKASHLIGAPGTGIKTLADDQRNNAKGHGISGGTIDIQTMTATGELTISLIGQDGANGTEPAPLGKNGQGARGKNGKNAKAVFIPLSGTIPMCIKRPTNGGRGGNGKTGSHGQNGFHGGSSGSLIFSSLEDLGLKLIVERQTGKGGLGSRGGLGGSPGPGGKAGACKRPCKCAKQGASGKEGPRGASGRNGSDGSMGSVCISKNASELAQCF